MDKAQAIAWFKEIDSGVGVDRYKHLNIIPRGAIAVTEWDGGIFTLGIEYGAMMAIVEIFDLEKEDIE